MSHSVQNLQTALDQIDGHWQPHRLTSINDYDVKVAKLQGEFVWHSHPETDELFLVISGELTIQLCDGDVVLREGDVYVVARGVEHCPRADGEVAALLIEPAGTINTGDAGGPMTSVLRELTTPEDAAPETGTGTPARTAPREIAERRGPRPTTSDDGPHRQVDQQAPPAIWGELVARVLALDGVTEGTSQVSPASSRAVFLTDQREERSPETSLAPGQRLEPVHLHGVDDTSLHLVLPPARAAELAQLGWAEAHQYADFGTEVMIYGPCDAEEVDVVLAIVAESLAFARG